MAEFVDVYQSIVEHAAEPIILVDPEYDILFSNRAARLLLGPELSGRNLRLVLRHPDVLAGVGKAFSREKEQIVQYTVPMPTDRSFDIAIRPVLLRNSDPVVVITMHETTMARETEKMRSDFVSNVSHELRSPLASLTGFIETLIGPAADDPKAQKRFLGIMADEASRMARLIDDLLSLSKVEVNVSLPPTDIIHINNLVSGVLSGLQMRADENDVTLKFVSNCETARVIGDNDQLMQVFQNLIENAIKYGAPNSAVEITLSEAVRIPDVGGKGISIAVKDHGEGIAAEHIARLTERFYRIDKGRSREVGGTGLGLAIVKHIVNRHRGRLIIESTQGVGSTFTVYLPSE